MRKKTLKRGWTRFEYIFDYKWVVLFFLIFASTFFLTGFYSGEISNFSVADVSLDWLSSSGSLLTGAVIGLQGDLKIQTSVLDGANTNVTIYWFNTTITLTNDTADANDQDAADDVEWWMSDSTTNQAIFGHSNTFNKIHINVSTTTFADYVGGFEYWDGSSWATLSVTNETQIFRTLDIHPLSFTAPGDWATTTIDGQGPYYFVMMNCTSGCGGGLGIAQISLSEIASDSTKPNVTTLIPAANSVFNVSNVIEIAANVTDDVRVHVVLANVTYPNGTINQLTLANASTHNNKFNISFTVPGLIGNYNITFIANDTTNNINRSESSNFTINDVIKPNVTTLLPAINTIYNTTYVVEVAANVTDDVRVHVVLANVTYPNGTINQLTLANASTHNNKFNISFNVPPKIRGAYNITFIANDTSGNVNNSESSNFTFQDIAVLPGADSNITIYLLNDSGAGLFVEDTADANDQDGVGDVAWWGVSPNGQISFGHTAMFNKIFLNVTTATLDPYDNHFEYWDGNSWATLTVFNETQVFSATGLHIFNFTAPSNWATTTLNGTLGPYYYVRMLCDSGTQCTGMAVDQVSLLLYVAASTPASSSTGSGGTVVTDTTAVVTDTTSSTAETTTTETVTPISTPQPIAETATTAEEVTTLIETGKITAQVTTTVETVIPQTTTETTAMTKQTSATTKSVSSEPITTTEQITISLTNTGDRIIMLQPELEEDAFVLENEEMVEKALKMFIFNLASLEDEILTEDEVQQKIIEEKKIITLIEKENVQPLFKQKTWSLADSFEKEATIWSDISAGEAAEQTKIIATEPIAITEEVKISFTNQDEEVIFLQPELEEKKIVLENENKIVVALRKELIQAGKEEGKILTEEEIEKKVNLFKLIERENIQPIFKKKSFSLLDYFKPDSIIGSFVGRKKGITYTGQQITGKFLGIDLLGGNSRNSFQGDLSFDGGITYTGQQITGKLLESHITGCGKIIVQPGESFEQTCTVQRGISAEPQPLKIIFKSSEKDVLERQVNPQESGIGAAVDVDKENRLLELYMLIPTIESGSEEFNDYFLEIIINEPSNDIFENISEESKSSVLFADLYGPYEVRGDKGFVFAQQLEYNPAVYFGNKFIETKLFKNNKLVAQHGFAVDLGEPDGQLEILFSNKTIYQALVLLSVFLVLFSFVGLSFLIKRYNVQIKNINFDNKLIVRIILVSVSIILLLSIGLLSGNSRNSSQGDLSFDDGITYSGQHITGKLLESHLEDCGEIIILPGEAVEKTCTIRRGISARTAPLKITFKAFGEKVLERQVDPQESGIGAAVDVDKENQLLELYMLIPTMESGSEEFNDYFLEITINELFGEIYEGSKSSVLFADLYGPFLVRQDKGFVFAQQLEYNPAVYFGNKVVKTKLLKNEKVVAEHEFNVDFGNAGGQLDLMFTNKLSLWALLLAIILLVFIPGFVFLYLVRKHRLK